MSLSSLDARISDWSAPEGRSEPNHAKRVRFSPRWLTLAVAVIGALLLYVAYPEQSWDWYMKQGERVDPVLSQLLRASLRREPSNVRIRLALARQLIAEDALNEAERTLAPLLESTDRMTHMSARLIEVDLAERQVMAAKPNTKARSDRVDRLAKLIDDMSREEDLVARLAPRVRRTLAAQLESRTGADMQRSAQIRHALDLLRQRERTEVAAIATVAPPGAVRPGPVTPLELAQQLLGEGRHADAAAAYLQAMQMSPSYAVKRARFLDAMRTFQAASKFDEAFAAAAAQGEPFMHDLVVVEFLVRLGRAANRPDIAERYVRVMLRLSSGPSGPSVPDNPSIALSALALRLLDWVIPQAHAAEEKLTINLPFDEDRFRLAFEVFLGNKNQGAARQVAAEAVRREPKNALWRKRYAQVCEWDGKAHLALAQWLAYAELTDSEEGWGAVKRLATPLYAHAAELKLLERELKRNPNDIKVIRSIVATHERIGSTAAAIAFLQERSRQAKTPELLMSLAELARRVGNDRVTLAAYDSVIARFGPDVKVAMQQATIAHSLGDAQGAWRVIAQAKGKARDSDVEYWRAYAHLATLIGDFEAAAQGLRVLAQRPDAQAQDLANLIDLLNGRFPVEAARMAEAGYRQFGRVDWLVHALQLYSEQRDWASFKRVLGQIAVSDRAGLVADGSFLVLRAAYYQATNAAALAAGDLDAAITVQPKNLSTRPSVLWMLLAMRRLEMVRVALGLWHKNAEDNRDLWAPFAAAYMALDEPRNALRYYRKLLDKSNPGYLQLLSYASALERIGERDLAWRLRRHAWLKMRRPDAVQAVQGGSRGSKDEREFKLTVAQLAITFANSDASAALINELIQTKDGTSLSPATKELALSWLLSVDAPDAALAWYLQQYARELATSKDHPYWALLSIALGRDDRPAIAQLLDNQVDLLPLSDRIEANLRLGNTAEAATLAHEQFSRFPDNQDAHERFTSLVMEDPPRVVGEGKRSQIGALGIISDSLRGTYDLTNRVRLGVSFDNRTQSSRDRNVLAWVPPQDRTLGATARLRSDLGVFGLAVAQREAFANHTALRLVWSKQTERGATGLSAGLNQPAFESNVLRLGGKKDTVEGTFNYRLTKYDTVNSLVRVERFASQNGIQLGSGRVASLEYSHSLRLDYPDIRARAFVTSSQYTSNGAMDPAFAAFYPDGKVPSPELVVPQSATVSGLGFTLGTSTEGRYMRAWRPFMDVALLKNSVIGQGSIARAGLAGSVVGSDRLSFYFNYARGVRGSNDVTREFDVQYAW